MTESQIKVENQHYVPKFLLRNFTSRKKKKLWVYDKQEENTYSTNVKNTATERNFYVLKNGDNEISIEPWFALLDSKAGEVVSQIIHSESIQGLSKEEWDWFILFVAFQFIRTRQQLETLKNFKSQMIEWFKVRDMDSESINYSDQDLKNALLSDMFKNIPRLQEALESKYVLLFKTGTSTSFYTSDHPVVQHNDNDGLYGNLGLETPGIQVYLPLSSQLLIGFWCRSVGNTIYDTKQKIDFILRAEQNQPGFFEASQSEMTLQKLKDKSKRLDNLHNALAGISPCPVDPEELTFMNHLQVIFSNRFVYSSQDDFSLVKRMINNNSKYKTGLMPEVIT